MAKTKTYRSSRPGTHQEVKGTEVSQGETRLREKTKKCKGSAHKAKKEDQGKNFKATKATKKRETEKQTKERPIDVSAGELQGVSSVHGSTGTGCIEKTQKEIQLEAEIKKEEIRLRNLDWIAERQSKDLQPIWTMDIETDPFSRGNLPVPFAIGFYNGERFFKFWSDRNGTCVEKARNFLEDQDAQDRGIVYMHNGGRFDFFYLLEWFQGKTTIMGSRIVKALMPMCSDNTIRKKGTWATCFEFRDSYAIMPFPLAAYKKDQINIEKLRRENRHKHKAEIDSYLEGDCVYLWELCMEFTREFGDYLTIASAAFAQLKNFHKFERMPQSQDVEMRKRFYYGGRVQCFKKGIINQPCKIYDVNSMYPAVMRNFWHPTGWCVTEGTKILWPSSNKPQELRTYFLTVEGKNSGAFPTRLRDGSIDFTVPEGVFHVSIHEWLVAMEFGLFKPTRVIRCYNFADSSRFDQFVDHFFSLRYRAKSGGDKMRTLFYKFILNSAYGKFALNPENYFSWEVTKTAEQPKGEGWVMDSLVQGKYYVWKKPGKTFDWNLYNIATAASITGAARSVLLRAVALSSEVLYCDTDSIICSEFAGGDLNDKKLGAWKTEAEGDSAAIAGKKLYAVFSGAECIKQANKGVNLTPDEIRSICMGGTVVNNREAPSFQRDGSAKFISRTVRMT